MKLWRGSSFWTEPWFLTLAVILGQLYGVWWMSLGTPEPIYEPLPMAMASVDDPFTITVTAPALPGHAEIQQALPN